MEDALWRTRSRRQGAGSEAKMAARAAIFAIAMEQ
ncbi:hypothetical protein chiPu_0028688, partial [Chiloscyllium punctatum]|nr:hypothetical protein [Chiloscyllium punctatum]